MKKGNQRYFGIKAQIGVDANLGLVHSVATTVSVADITQVPQLLHGAETRAWADAGYEGVSRRRQQRGRRIDLQVARRPGPRWRVAPGSAGRPGGATQGLQPGKNGESISLCEAPLRLRPGALSGIGREVHPAVPVARVRQSGAGGARRAGISGRSTPRAGTITAHPPRDGWIEPAVAQVAILVPHERPGSPVHQFLRAFADDIRTGR